MDQIHLSAMFETNVTVCGTLLVPWFGRWRYIAYSCEKALCCTRAMQLNSTTTTTITATTAAAISVIQITDTFKQMFIPCVHQGVGLMFK